MRFQDQYFKFVHIRIFCTEKTLNALLLFVLLIGVFGCQKSWLDAKPSQSLAVPSTLTDFQALMDDNDQINLYWTPALGEIASDGHYLSDAVFPNLQNVEINAYTWSHSLPDLQDQDWAYTYSRVFQANIVLEGLAGFGSLTQANHQTFYDIMGQALFVRAMSFFEASQEFAPPYDSSTASTDLGIPLRLSSDINLKVVRSTIKQSYDQIIGDLLQAKDLLPVTPVFLSRPSKPAVFALLARVYLSVGDYVDAGNYADSCLSINNTLLDYNSLIAPSIPPVPLNNPPVPLYNIETLFYGSLNTYYSLFGFNTLIDTSLYSLYDSNDLRKVIFFTVNSDSTISFQGSYTNTVIQFGGIANDEIYLIRAECFARIGDTTSALNNLNVLLQKRYLAGTFVPEKAVSVADALNKILLERRKELLLRGLRWTDLRRLNKDPNFAITISRTINGKTYTLAPNTYQYTFPIPDDIIQQSGIQQNKGW